MTVVRLKFNNCVRVITINNKPENLTFRSAKMTLLSILSCCTTVTCVYRSGHSTHDVYQDLYRALLYSSLSVARSEVSTIVLIINTEQYPGIPTTEKGKKC